MNRGILKEELDSPGQTSERLHSPAWKNYYVSNQALISLWHWKEEVLNGYAQEYLLKRAPQFLISTDRALAERQRVAPMTPAVPPLDTELYPGELLVSLVMSPVL